MTLTFGNNSCLGQRGLTLLELLIAMAIFALIAALASASLKGVANQRAVWTAAQQMRADLIRARTEADIAAVPILVELSEAGYVIGSINVARRFPSNTLMRMENEQRSIVFGPEFQLGGYEIRLVRGDAGAVLTIAPFTSAIDVRR